MPSAAPRGNPRSEGVGLAGAVRSTPRLTGIIRVLARHGFLGLVRGKQHWPSPVHARETLEELGVVFLKFGQVLATRRDLIPEAYAVELERLHDRLPPLSLLEVRSTIERELGATVEELYAEFDEAPLAAATIAQVHTAMLHDGRRVVVKVRREGLNEQIAEDTAVLTYLAAMAERFLPQLRTLDSVGMVREFRASLVRETDLSLEGRTIRRFRAALVDVEGLWIPDVIDERTAPGVLTMEHSPGERVDRYAEQHPEAREALGRNVAALLLHQVFETGLFHADPHPGNIFVLPDGRLCLHDFGMIGEIDEPTRDGLIAMLEASVVGDARAATDAYLDLGLVGTDIDRSALEADLTALLQRIRERPLAEVSIGEALQALLRVGTGHRVRNPGVLLLLARAFLIVEAIVRSLDPAVNVITLFRAQVQRVALARYTPTRLAGAGERLARDIERMLQEAPADLRRVLRRTADGDLGRVRAPELEVLGLRASRSLERLTGAVACAGLVIAGAMLVMIDGWHHTAGEVLLFVGVLGILATAIGALRRPGR